MLSGQPVTGAVFKDRIAWTPVLNFGGATTGITYSVQTGTYWRLGNGDIVVYFSITLSSVGSATGAATITGLPVAANPTYSGGCNIVYWAAMAAITSFNPYVGGATSTIQLAQPGSVNTNTNYSNANFTATSTLNGFCQYSS
jgi:hypothetical protein